MLRNPFVIILIVIVVLGVLGYVYSSGTLNPGEKMYVAVEGDGKIAVIDTAKKKVIKNIALAEDHEGSAMTFAPHDVRVAPDGNSVWVSANAGMHQDHSSFVPAAHAHGDEAAGAGADEIIVIDPKSDRITQRIPIAEGIGLAHVVLTPDSKTVYVTAQKEGVVYKVNAATYKIEKEIKAPSGSEPHSIWFAPEIGALLISFLANPHDIGVLDISTDVLRVEKRDALKLPPDSIDGMVITKSGVRYVANRSTGSVQVLDDKTGQEVGVISVGKEPNSVSVWSKALGGTP